MPKKACVLGKRFHRLIVVKEIKKRIPPYNHRRYQCACDCGRKVIVDVGNLGSGNTKSCGCLMRETSAANGKKWLSSPKARAVREEMRLRHHGKGLRNFWKNVDSNGGISRTCDSSFGNCWIWKGCRNDGGYGRLTVDYKEFPATHIAFYLATGDLPQGEVMHACDNPSCVNPRHLIDGTARDNAYDRKMKGKGFILVDALTAQGVPPAGEPNLGTEEHAQ
jgi:hypothetical protein